MLDSRSCVPATDGGPGEKGRGDPGTTRARPQAIARRSSWRALAGMCVLTAALTARTAAQTPFEGVIESKNTTIDEHGHAQQFHMTMFVKADKVRIENTSVGDQPASTTIYRGDKKLVWMLNDDEKTYFEIRQEDQGQEVISAPGQKTTKPVVRMTGKKKAILRFPCEQIIVTGEGTETEIWATRSLGHVYSAISQVLGGGNEWGGEDWENKVTGLGYYPLLASSKLNGKVVESQAVTGIERKALSDTLFVLPEGFTKQSSEGGGPE